jgi:hypothetical protein
MFRRNKKPEIHWSTKIYLVSSPNAVLEGGKALYDAIVEGITAKVEFINIQGISMGVPDGEGVIIQRSEIAMVLRTRSLR